MENLVNAYRKIFIIISYTVALGLLLSSLVSLWQDSLLSEHPDARPFHFSKILSRSLTIVLFFVMIWFCRTVEKRSLISYGLETNPATIRLLMGGFLLGIFSMLTLVALHLNFYDSSIHIKELSIRFYFNLVFQLFVVLTIALVEEWFFRGFLLEILSKDYGNKKGVIISSFIFAMTHFVRPISEISHLIPEFFGLFLIGVILAYSTILSGSLYFAIGIHSGWVYIVKIDKYFVNHFDSSFQKIIGGEKLLNSLSSWVLALVVLGILKYLIKVCKNSPKTRIENL
jgi:membrane protease YdiL (CAAX protease family)